jgi:hypothetical protein
VEGSFWEEALNLSADRLLDDDDDDDDDDCNQNGTPVLSSQLHFVLRLACSGMSRIVI